MKKYTEYTVYTGLCRFQYNSKINILLLCLKFQHVIWIQIMFTTQKNFYTYVFAFFFLFDKKLMRDPQSFGKNKTAFDFIISQPHISF